MATYELSLENIKKGLRHPFRALDEVVFDYTFRLPMTIVNGFHTIGTNVFEQDWDILIIIDTCRVDALREVQDEYDFLTDIGHIWSVGGRTPEWVARTFDKQHLDIINDTIYLSANNFIVPILETKRQETKEAHLKLQALRLMPTVDIEDFKSVEYLFEYEPPGQEGPLGHKDGNTPPRYVTDRAVEIGRTESYDRLIVHYFQPHSPWVANATDPHRDLKSHEDDWWGYLTETGDVETVWNSYLDELRYVLNDIKVLLENVDAKTVVISADHGEAFGEFKSMGHKTGSLHPKVRKVPWVETTASDKSTYTPSTKKPEGTDTTAEELDEQLEALGYKM